MKTKDFAVIPFTQRIIKDRYLVSNVLGCWDFLEKDEFRMLSSLNFEAGTPLFRRLRERGLVVDAHNLKNVIDDYRSLNANLFNDTSLHIAVLTTRCNLRCGYCQARSSALQDMQCDVAAHVLKVLFDVRNKNVTLEFQGGEPLLNWKTLAYLAQQARALNTGSKDLRLALVTNFTLVDEGMMQFISDHDIEVCVSLDGPRSLHDKNRVFEGGRGTYDIVVRNVEKYEKKFNKKISLLPTITKNSFTHYKELIDEYVRLGQTTISLRPVNKMGNACARWENVGYTAEEFIAFYRKAFDYILQLNRRGVDIQERTAGIILKKVLKKADPGYVEMMNPCGAGRGQIVYMPDGSCFPCDEARMVGDDILKMGNIVQESYEDLMKKENVLHLLEASLLELYDTGSVYRPWMGTCPVVNYAMHKDFVNKVWCSPAYRIYHAQFDYLFGKILEGKDNLEIFNRWLKKEVCRG